MKGPFISVIIPTYNREDTIKYCLESVLNQTYSNIEIIIVDDCSSDKTIDIIKSYNDTRIKLIQLDQNSGAQKARNVGIKAATADWIALQDSDDEWLLDKLEKQVTILEKNNFNDYLVIHSDAILLDLINNERRLFNIPKVEGENVYPVLLSHSSPFFQAMLTSKKAFEEIDYLDENVPSYQEWDTSIRLAKICEFIQMDEPTFIYYLHEGETISKSLKRDIEGYEYIINKFKKEIIKYCGKKIWMQHLMIQYNKCINWNFLDDAQKYLNKIPISSKKIKMQIKLFKLKLKSKRHI